jgi:hypothetical protein
VLNVKQSLLEKLSSFLQSTQSGNAFLTKQQRPITFIAFFHRREEKQEKSLELIGAEKETKEEQFNYQLKHVSTL